MKRTTPQSPIDRMVSVLNLFTPEVVHLRYTDIKRMAGIRNSATLSSLLSQMVDNGILRSRRGTGYALGPLIRHWNNALPPGPSLRQRARPLLEELSRREECTALLIERQGRTVRAADKVMHEDAPALMETGNSFAPRLPYFGCILFLSPPSKGIRGWVKGQMADVNPAVAARIKQGVEVTRHYLREGYYEDTLLYPGQYRLAYAVTNAGGEIEAVVGVARSSVLVDNRAKASLREKVRDAARELSTRRDPQLCG